MEPQVIHDLCYIMCYLGDLFLAFKCINCLAPDYLGKHFVKHSAVHNKNKRECHNFVVPQCGLSMAQRAFYFGFQEHGMD